MKVQCKKEMLRKVNRGILQRMTYCIQKQKEKLMTYLMMHMSMHFR